MMVFSPGCGGETSEGIKEQVQVLYEVRFETVHEKKARSPAQRPENTERLYLSINGVPLVRKGVPAYPMFIPQYVVPGSNTLRVTCGKREPLTVSVVKRARLPRFDVPETELARGWTEPHGGEQQSIEVTFQSDAPYRLPALEGAELLDPGMREQYRKEVLAELRSVHEWLKEKRIKAVAQRQFEGYIQWAHVYGGPQPTEAEREMREICGQALDYTSVRPVPWDQLNWVWGKKGVLVYVGFLEDPQLLPYLWTCKLPEKDQRYTAWTFIRHSGKWAVWSHR
jgi:hypothetical protein